MDLENSILLPVEKSVSTLTSPGMPSEAVEAYVLLKRSKQNKVLVKKIDNIVKTDLSLTTCPFSRFDTVYSPIYVIYLALIDKFMFMHLIYFSINGMVNGRGKLEVRTFILQWNKVAKEN